MIFRYKMRKEDAAADEEDKLRKLGKKPKPKKVGKTKGKGGKGKSSTKK